MRAALTVVVAGLGGGMLCAGLLAGCSAAAPPAPQESSPSPEGPGAASGGRFTGPWADLFESTAAEVTTDDERRALDDSEISAEEYAYFQDRILECLDGLGVEGQFNPDGSLDYSAPPSATREAIRACNADNGIRIVALHDAIVRNPTHRDETEIMLECLQRVGLVGSGYSKADLENGVDLEKLGVDPDFAGCAADPLGYGAG